MFCHQMLQALNLHGFAVVVGHYWLSIKDGALARFDPSELVIEGAALPTRLR
jgi:hypothetical protein